MEKIISCKQEALELTLFSMHTKLGWIIRLITTTFNFHHHISETYVLDTLYGKFLRYFGYYPSGHTIYNLSSLR